MNQDQRARKNIHASYGDAFFNSFMVGIGETYLAAFVLSLGHSDLLAGWITSLPLLAGGLLQMFAPHLVCFFGSPKKWVIMTATVQAITLFCLALQAHLGIASFSLIFLLSTTYWATGMAGSPLWNTWIESIIPFQIRTSFFATRNALGYLAVLLGLIVGGWWLHSNQKIKIISSSNFLFLFALAGFFRLLSIYQLTKQSDTKISIVHSSPSQHWSHLKVLFCQPLARKLFLFMFILGIGVHSGAGFFSPLMLSGIHMSYGQYTTMLATALLARVITIMWLKRNLRQWRCEKILLLSIVGIIPLPLLWNFSHQFYYLLSLQILSGASWGVYELITFLLLFNGISTKEKTAAFTLFNFLQTLSIFIGAVGGGWYLHSQGASIVAYENLFYISTVIRLLSLLFFPYSLLSRMTIQRWVFTRPMAVRPSSGALGRPLITETENSMKEQTG